MPVAKPIGLLATVDKKAIVQKQMASILSCPFVGKGNGVNHFFLTNQKALLAHIPIMMLQLHVEEQAERDRKRDEQIHYYAKCFFFYPTQTIGFVRNDTTK